MRDFVNFRMPTQKSDRIFRCLTRLCHFDDAARTLDERSARCEPTRHHSLGLSVLVVLQGVYRTCFLYPNGLGVLLFIALKNSSYRAHKTQRLKKGLKRGAEL